jgi:sorbitol-6-phosphate 2-dehydrogenase
MSSSWLGLEGKVVIVTGGASGIGLNITNGLINKGAKVVVADLNGEEGQQSNGSYFIKCDVTSKESVDLTVKKTVELFGSLEILVNNAGVNLPWGLKDLNHLYERRYSSY